LLDSLLQELQKKIMESVERKRIKVISKMKK